MVYFLTISELFIIQIIITSGFLCLLVLLLPFDNTQIAKAECCYFLVSQDVCTLRLQMVITMTASLRILTVFSTFFTVPEEQILVM